ncbi:extracellular solute-binding protein [Mesorhizobium sp. LHD-90]|uniref:ABC transporter substrate-binding protein n=1 Tax=Mesorhizobium sp. LHD-90 TaxID=3071414 RepID=UPI0027DED11E|nr:extracellular solute-binding protein [Mesorhizobium sp. LHD-90]MDQ6438187.1 extracellular solute-binding protein [Mesorhizobium sp. LHD-90]
MVSVSAGLKISAGRARALLVGCAVVLPSAASAQNVELKVWSQLTTASQTDVIKKHVNECIANMPGVSVEFESVTLDTLYSRLLTSLQRGDVPDVMNTTEGVVAFLSARDALHPVTGIVDKLGKDDFRQSNLNAVSKDNQIWAIPDWALHQEVWYRKDLFAAAGIQPPKSWADLLTAAKALNVDTNGDGNIDRYGFAVPMARVQVAAQTYFQILYSAGGTIFDPKTGEYAFAAHREKAIEALEFMIELYKAASPPASVEWSYNDFRTAIVKDQVAMTNEWGAVVLIAKEQNPEMLDNFSVFPFPGPDAGQKPAAALAGGYYYLMTKTNEAKEAASAALLECMFTPERLAERTNSRPIFAIPATQSAFDNSVYTSNEFVEKFRPELEIIFNEVMGNWYRYGSEAGMNPLTGQIEATSFVGDAIQNAALGRSTAAEAVDAIDQQFRQLIEQK